MNPKYVLALTCAACATQPAQAQNASRDEEKRAETAIELARELGISDDDQRPENQKRLKILGKPVTLGGEVSSGFQYRKGYELVRGADDDDFKFSPELKLEAIIDINEKTVGFAAGKIFADSTIYKEGGGTSTEVGVQLDEAWVLRTGLFNTPLAIQVGRQQVKERREWWWDEDLDAVRLHYFGKKVTGFVGAGRQLGYYSTLGRLDPEDRKIDRLFGQLNWDWADRQEIGLFGLVQRDKSRRYSVGDIISSNRIDDEDSNLNWIGLRGRGRIKAKFPGKTNYWFDIARIRGTQLNYDLSFLTDESEMVTTVGRRKVGGWAVDAGVSIELPFAFEPYLTLGYARGSGDKTPGGRDTRFRQSGLHNNNGKFRGLSRFRYYGEVLRPDLSNMAITTVAFGAPIKETTWVELIWHRYRQPVADDRISGSRLDMDPLGTSRKIGDEIDVVVTRRPSRALEFELTGGAFRAGSAFGPQQGRWAWILDFKIDLNF